MKLSISKSAEYVSPREQQAQAESATVVGEIAQTELGNTLPPRPDAPITNTLATDGLDDAAGGVARRALANPNLPSYTRIYEPLDGNELIEAMCAHFRRTLTNSGKFKDYLIYQRATWKYDIFVQWDAFANGASTQHGEGEVRGESEPADAPTTEATESTLVSGTQLNPDMAPDEIREKTGQTVPVLERAGTGTGLGGSSTIKRVDPKDLKGRR